MRRYVQARDAGRPVTGPSRRERITDPYAGKIEEWVDRTRDKVRADVVHERLVGLGFTGTERSTRRAVAEAKRVQRLLHESGYSLQGNAETVEGNRESLGLQMSEQGVHGRRPWISSATDGVAHPHIAASVASVEPISHHLIVSRCTPVSSG